MKSTGKVFLLLLFITVSCKSVEIPVDQLDAEAFYTISDSLQKDEEVETFLDQHRIQYMREMGRPVATASEDFHYGQPESSLGNLAADMIRFRATHEKHRFVHIALINPDGLRVVFEEGVITLGDLYEFMPYDNTLVILEMKGSDVRKLADEIAEQGGVPLSGMRMTITGGKATGILVDSESIDPDNIYYVATSNYLADGNSGFSSLGQAAYRHDYPLLIRDLFIDYMRSRRVFTPLEDLRVRIR